MKIHGFCNSCNRIRLIRANSRDLVRMAQNQPVYGQCDACAERERLAAQDRHPSRRGR